MDHSELAEELEHQRELVKALRQRRRHLERAHVIKGIDTDPHILMQIEDIGRQIKERESEIALLQSHAVETTVSFVEAEYRAALAYAWNDGQLTTMGSTTLELTRLRLGISFEQAHLLEADIRRSIARDKLAEQDRNDIILRVREQLSYMHKSDVENRDELLKGICQGAYAHLSRLKKAIALDIQTVADWMNEDAEVAFTSGEVHALIEISNRHRAASSGCRLVQLLDFLIVLQQASTLAEDHQ